LSANAAGGSRAVEKVRERYARHHRELTRMIRARMRFDRTSGYLAAKAAVAAAYRAETGAAVDLILAAPASAAEASTKGRYMSRGFDREWWTSEDRASPIVARFKEA
jgi:hypothetical protein